MGENPDYIHASFVNVSVPESFSFKDRLINTCMQGHCEKAFIIAQSPMENTVRDFWKMVVDQSVPAVVMLCDLEEDNVSRPHNGVLANK